MNSRTRLFDAILLLFALLAIAYPVAGFEILPETATKSADLTFTGPNFAGAAEQGVVAQTDGLQPAEQSLTSLYTSPVIEAPLSFNVVIPQWVAYIPAGASLSMAVRTGTADGRWSDWYPIHENDDWTLPEDPDVVGDLITIPAADKTHQYIQYTVGFSRDNGQTTPILKELRLTFIDSTNGPTLEEMIAQQQALDAANQPNDLAAGAEPQSFSKPFVISRAVWCIDPSCNYTDGLEYEPVQQLILHHTVSSNSSSDWVAVVRAIWKFHKDTRGWGDIGYNYLADKNGVLYEGHLGGDDVIGTHASAANSGTMALSLLGTFTLPTDTPPGIEPPPAMLNAAADLFAWKADQKDIDVYSAGRLPNMSWGTPNLMGHRDVYGGTNTECPGEQAYRLLPWLRDAVAQRINFQSPYAYVDELSANFTRSNQGGWYEGPEGCGNSGHSFYTWSVTNPAESTNWGEWKLPVSSNGRYEIQVYAPYCTTGRAETSGANYQVTHASGSSNVVINVNSKVGQWMSLGEFSFNADGRAKLRLTDLTATDAGLGVWFDAIRFRYVGDGPPPPLPTAQPVQPVGVQWLTQRTVSFSWSIDHPESVNTTWLQVATDPNFVSLVLDQSWPTAVTTSSHTFNQDYPNLYWRVVLASGNDNRTISSVTRFAIDAQSPTTAVQTIYLLGWNNSLVVFWGGQDTTSGIANYSVEYRPVGGSTWSPWLTNTSATSASFHPPSAGTAYEFRSRAADLAGNVEPAHPNADLSTLQAKPLPHAIMMAIIRHK